MLAQLRSGDERAFNWLITNYHDQLVRLARVFVRDDEAAREVAQDVWVGVLAGLPGFEGRSSLKTWIFRITVNIAKTRGVRDTRSVPIAEIDERAADENTPETHVMDREELALVAHALSRLPASQAATVFLHDVEGLDATEVSHVLGVSPSNLRVLHHRARSKLRYAVDRSAA